VLPDLEAGCSLAASCQPAPFAALKAKHPSAVVVSYVNTTAAIKAMSDYVCTSSNAVAVVNAIPKGTPIIFAPDVNLGRYVMQKAGRDLILWQGTCEVHETFNERYLIELMAEHPEAELIAHPECDPSVLRHAKVVGSTKALLEHTKKSPARSFIVATEEGILYTMRKASPGKTFITAAPEKKGDDPSCGCSTCPHMKRNTLEKVYLCLRDLTPEILLDEELRIKALKPIERMVEFG